MTSPHTQLTELSRSNSFNVSMLHKERSLLRKLKKKFLKLWMCNWLKLLKSFLSLNKCSLSKFRFRILFSTYVVFPQFLVHSYWISSRWPDTNWIPIGLSHPGHHRQQHCSSPPGKVRGPDVNVCTLKRCSKKLCKIKLNDGGQNGAILRNAELLCCWCSVVRQYHLDDSEWLNSGLVPVNHSTFRRIEWSTYCHPYAECATESCDCSAREHP